MSKSITRRQALKTRGRALPFGVAVSDATPFRHREHLSGSHSLIPGPARAPLAIPAPDVPIVKDYGSTFARMKRLRCNASVICGLYVAPSWPLGMSSTMSSESGALVSGLIEAEPEQGSRVYIPEAGT
jgi:hypothetical protein